MALPAAEVAVANPPPLPRDFDTLVSLARHLKTVFRVWDGKSASQLLWNGEKETSGFSCPNQNLARLSPTAYRKAQGEKRGSITWAEGPYLRQTIVDHILGAQCQTAIHIPSRVDGSDETIAEDDKSPWISVSRELAWCVWDIARRLAWKYDHPSTANEEGSGEEDGSEAPETVHLTVIRHHSGTVGLSDPRRIYLEVHVDPKGPLRNAMTRSRGEEMSLSAKEKYETARKETERSGEILYYGRIFSDSIDGNTDWTFEVSCLLSPSKSVHADPWEMYRNPDWSFPNITTINARSLLPSGTRLGDLPMHCPAG